MREQRLLERLTTWDKYPDNRSGTDPGKIVDSVLEHLQRILNTRHGSVQIAEDYGLPDFTDIVNNYPESIRDLERSIRHMIQKYEPRLSGVRVNFIPQENDMLSLSFKIVARLELDDQKMPVLFESQVDTSGKVSVKG